MQLESFLETSAQLLLALRFLLPFFLERVILRSRRHRRRCYNEQDQK